MLRRTERFELSGTLLAEEQNVPNERVRLSRDGQFVGEATTDSGGSFAFSDLPRGQYRLELSGDLMIMEPAAAVRVDQDLRGLIVRGQRSCAVAGIVLGFPLEQDEVEVSARKGSSIRYSAIERPHGAFRFAKLPPGNWLIEATVPGGHGKASVLVECPAGGEVVDLMLLRGD